MKLTKQRLKDLILETLYEGDDDPEENLYDDEGLEGDKFVPDMHAASRGGDLDSDDGPVGMADTMHAKRIISKELMNIKSALRVDDFADARASLRKVNVFMKNIDKDDFPGARMSESVRTVSKEKLYKLIKEEMQNVFLEEAFSPEQLKMLKALEMKYPNRDTDPAQAAAYTAAHKKIRMMSPAPASKSPGEGPLAGMMEQFPQDAQDMFDKMDDEDFESGESEEGGVKTTRTKTTLENWKLKALAVAANGMSDGWDKHRAAFEETIAPANPEEKAMLLQLYQNKDIAGIQKWAAGR